MAKATPMHRREAPAGLRCRGGWRLRSAAASCPDVCAHCNPNRKNWTRLGRELACRRPAVRARRGPRAAHRDGRPSMPLDAHRFAHESSEGG